MHEKRVADRTTDAKKERFGEKEALRLAQDADEMYVAKRGNVVYFDLKKRKPSKAELLAAMMGPTGNLRAPVMRMGRTLVIGFDEATYRKVVK